MKKEERRDYNQKYYYTHQEEILKQKKEYCRNNIDSIKERNKIRYDNNKEAQIEQQREYYSRPENRIKKLYWKSQERAKEEGILFEIEMSDIVIPQICPYLGIELTHQLGKGQLITNSSLDRIDNTKGYIPGNVRVISRLANTMKNNSTREQREAFAKAILSDPTL